MLMRFLVLAAGRFGMKFCFLGYLQHFPFLKLQLLHLLLLLRGHPGDRLLHHSLLLRLCRLCLRLRLGSLLC